MELIGVKEVMGIFGVGRPTATRILQSKKCPTLPRKKNAPYLVQKDAFMRFIEGQK